MGQRRVLSLNEIGAIHAYRDPGYNDTEISKRVKRFWIAIRGALNP